MATFHTMEYFLCVPRAEAKPWALAAIQAGPELKEECKKLPQISRGVRCKIGDAKVTEYALSFLLSAQAGLLTQTTADAKALAKTVSWQWGGQPSAFSAMLMWPKRILSVHGTLGAGLI